MMKRILHIGVFVSSNLGDCYISQSLSEHINRLGFETIPFDFAFKMEDSHQKKIIEPQYIGLRGMIKKIKIISQIYTWIKARKEELRGRKKFLNALETCDSVLLGGGNLLNGLDIYFPSRVRFFIKWALKKQKKIIIFGVGAGPYISTWSKRIIKKALRPIDDLAVRDNYSKQILRDVIGFKGNIEVVADPAFIGPNSVIDKQGNQGAGQTKTLAISVIPFLHPWIFPSGSIKRYNRFIKGFAVFLEKLVSRNSEFSLILFSSEKKDYFAVHDLKKELLLHKVEIEIFVPEALEDLIGFMLNIKGVIGFRLHSLIIAQSFCKPALGVVWQEKVRSFFLTSGLSDCFINSTKEGVDWSGFEQKLAEFLESTREISNRLSTVKSDVSQNYMDQLRRMLFF